MILTNTTHFVPGWLLLEARCLDSENQNTSITHSSLSYLDNSSDSNDVATRIEGIKKSLVILSLTRTPYNPLMWHITGRSIEDL